jgi:hypothetical protein
LDGVEIVMRTEETFGIESPNEIAAQLLTPAALVDFVAANVPLKATEAPERNPAQGSMAASLRRMVQRQSGSALAKVRARYVRRTSFCQTPSSPRCQSKPIAVRKERAIRADPVLFGCTRSQLIVAG